MMEKEERRDGEGGEKEVQLRDRINLPVRRSSGSVKEKVSRHVFYLSIYLWYASFLSALVRQAFLFQPRTQVVRNKDERTCFRTL